MSKLEISQTAFLVNESRARRKDISKDIYARNWILPQEREKIKELWELFSKKVYPYDDIELSVRNRYYLDLLKKFIKKHSNPIIVSLGVGLTSYPFLLTNRAEFVEVDLPNIIKYRKQRIDTLRNKKIIPKRNVNLYAVNLNQLEHISRLEKILIHDFKINERPSMIFMEGISYYLKKDSLTRLITSLIRIQNEGSILALDYWKPDIVHHPVFKRLQEFFMEKFNFPHRDYTLFKKEFIQELTQYRLKKATSIMAEEFKYNKKPVLMDNKENILPEYNIILQKE
jgi:O-methyltransferase involved in polyketide biosynthesis